MHEVSFDLLSINETRLDDSIHNDEVKIPGFDIVRKDRTRNGGGVAIYSRNTIPHTVRDDLIPTDTDIEAICLEINKPKNKPMLLSTWYRRHTQAYNYLTNLKTSYKKQMMKTRNLL